MYSSGSNYWLLFVATAVTGKWPLDWTPLHRHRRINWNHSIITKIATRLTRFVLQVYASVAVIEKLLFDWVVFLNKCWSL